MGAASLVTATGGILAMDKCWHLMAVDLDIKWLLTVVATIPVTITAATIN